MSIVAVLGASDDPERYSYKAIQLLQEKGHEVFPVHPTLKQIDGLKVYASLKDLPKPMDVLSVYLSKAVSDKMTDQILQAKVRRVIFNPGAENPELEAKVSSMGMKPLEACTLVLLRTDQFDKISNP